MKLILEIHPRHEDGQVEHRTLDAWPATLGRGFDNDVILSDPHVEARHVRIEQDNSAWFIQDLNSANGLFVNNQPHDGERLPLKSGDILRLGQTEIRVYTPDHPVPAALKIEKESPIFPWLAKPANVWGCFLLALAVMLGWSFLEIWTEEPGLTLSATAAATVGCIVVWAALWSVAGRLIIHKAGFRNHVAVASLYLIAGALAWYVQVYTDFLTNENWISQVVTYGINFTLLSLLLYGSLSLSTHMTEKRRMTASLFFSLGVIGGIYALGLIVAQNFNQQPPFPATLEPYLAGLAPAKTPDAFMAESETVFSSEKFQE